MISVTQALKITLYSPRAREAPPSPAGLSMIGLCRASLRRNLALDQREHAAQQPVVRIECIPLIECPS